MSLSPYHLHWSDALIKRVELRLRQVHASLEEFYRQKNYSAVAHATATAEEDAARRQQEEGPISSVGSFLLRTCVHSTPFYETQVEHGVGADIALKIPEEVCSLKDIHDGHYLERRQVFLRKLEKFMGKYNAQMMRKATQASAAAAAKGEDDEEVETEGPERRSVVQWDLRRVPVGGSFVNTEKELLRVYFLRPRHGATRREVFHVDVHLQPISLTGRIASAAAIRKHPLYSYLVQEDGLMTVHLRRLHELYSKNQSLVRATVFLKCWAYHVGLMSRTSGHPEGLSGFHISALLLRLVEEGLISPNMSEENVVRAVWVQLSRGFTQNASHSSGQEAPIPAAEERGEVAVLRLAGETMNLLFRTSAAFFQNIVKKAAEEALQLSHHSEVFVAVPFQPLQLRLDVCFTVDGLRDHFAEADSTPIAKTTSVAWSPSAQRVQAIQRLVEEALGARSSYATVWRRSHDSVHVAVRLTTEAEGRNRLTRGPAVEDAEAVERFNAFWGKDVTSTRQFPDGGIYRCVLWTFDEDAGANTTVALSAATVMRRVLEFALQKHLAPSAQVSQLLGGLEGALAERVGGEWRDAAPMMQKSLLEACRHIEAMVAEVPRTALPCKVTSLDIIAPSERHTATFPVRPHLALTYTTDDLTQPNFAGLTTEPTIEPVHGVLTIDDKNKIPDTPEAIAAIKGAICAQLSKVLQEYYGDDKKHSRSRSKRSLKREEGAPQQETQPEAQKFRIRTSCTSHSVDIIYKGYLFRLYIAHYREVSLLKALQRESEAAMIERKLFWSVQHAKFLRTVAFGHHSYAMAARLSKRWLSAMLLLEFVLPEAVELIVANAYLGSNPPKTSVGGFVRFLQLLATHDWSSPLVLPYSVDSRLQADTAELVRTMGEQQGMFIATPYAPMESPFTVHTPRPMIVHRVVQLAKSALAVLLAQLDGRETLRCWEGLVFTTDPATFDFHMAFHPHLLLQPGRLLVPPSAVTNIPSAAGTSAALSPFLGPVSVGAATSSAASGPQPPRIWQLDELEEDRSRVYLTELVEREPTAHVVRSVRAVTRDRCMVFYDCLAPHGIYVVTITPAPMREVCVRLHNDILRVSHGALLPSPSLPDVGAAAGKAKLEGKAPSKAAVKSAGRRVIAPAAAAKADADAAAAEVARKSSGKKDEGARPPKRRRTDDADEAAGATQRPYRLQGQRRQAPTHAAAAGKRDRAPGPANTKKEVRRA
ncbi:uncharacterized protein Tco025E_01796 [Trypanosoma conorhini]|uniref:U3 small nucleolar RNA-associated protein 22 n=1 Tax=Trypanosoma conorhini TaxID=83891 RepID=A0A422Q7L0_9TRYP|nr:uncharacterized protein Tco025E_01796 [Trypanosoma conorhini]RNF25950.1 hypothetical protein Tco025E_01796 [Trypanosoma conorhini]